MGELKQSAESSNTVVCLPNFTQAIFRVSDYPTVVHHVFNIDSVVGEAGVWLQPFKKSLLSKQGKEIFVLSSGQSTLHHVIPCLLCSLGYIDIQANPPLGPVWRDT